MNLLELFAGSRSVGQVGEELGFNVYSSDINEFDKINYAVNILEFDCKKVPFIPDVIWASPPCTFFSVASIGKHWNIDNTPKTENAKLGVCIVKKTIEIIDYYKKLNRNLVYFVENPRGKLRKLEVTKYFDIRHTVTYCKYGDKRMKPTDIWTNTMKWYPRPMCRNGDSCHESAPRGSATGTQGLKGSYERSKIPYELCLEILKSV
jgi:site-specific DNA-cytosine methylase